MQGLKHISEFHTSAQTLSRRSFKMCTLKPNWIKPAYAKLGALFKCKLIQ